METLKGHAAVVEMLRLMEENGRQEEAKEFSHLIAAVDSVGQQYDGLLAEVQDLKRRLAEAEKERHPLKDALARTVQTLEVRLTGVNTRLQVVRNRIALTAEKAVENFKRIGVSALDTAVSSLRIDTFLEAAQEKVFKCADDLAESIQKVEDVGRELRSAGSHVKNAGRAASGRETQTVDGGQEGRFQSAVLAPMRALQSSFERVGRTLYSALGAVDRLGRAADRNRGKRERVSVRRRLKTEAPACAVPALPAPAKRSREVAR